jgi:hypothetical protein
LPPAGLLADALGRISEERLDLRARLMGRLAPSAGASAVGTEERVASAAVMARRSGDPWATLICVVRHLVVYPYSTRLGDRDELVAEVERLAAAAGRTDLQLDAAAVRFRRLIEVGDLDAAEGLLPELARWEQETGLPPAGGFGQAPPLFLLARGLTEEAVQVAQEYFQSALTEEDRRTALGTFTLQVGLARWLQGRTGEVLPAIAAMLSGGGLDQGALEVAQAAQALFLAELEREPEARQAIASALVRPPAELALGQFGTGVLALAMLLQAAVLVGDIETVRRIEPHLAVLEGVTLTVGMPPLACVGAGDLHLGMAAATLGRTEDADRHYAAALAMNEGMGALPFVAHTHWWWAKLRAGIGDRAGATQHAGAALRLALELGMPELADRAEALLSNPSPTLPARDDLALRAETLLTDAVPVDPFPTAGGSASFRQEGDFWTVDFERRTVRLKDSKGMGYLARLLLQPGAEIHSLELVSADPGVAGRGGDAGPILDARAKESYRRRLGELAEELEEARANHDLGSAERAEAEIDALTDQLASAVGLGGRDRQTGAAAERARVAATRTIRAAIDRIADSHPALGAHLRHAVRTGTYCAYEPDPAYDMRWYV